MKGEFTTNYLPETYPEGFQGVSLNSSESLELAVIAAAMHAKEAIRASTVLNDGGETRANTTVNEWKLVVTVKDEDIPIALKKEGNR